MALPRTTGGINRVTATQLATEGGISGELNLIEDRTAHIGTLMKTLEERLEPVLRSKGPESGCSPNAPSCGGPLRDRLSSTTRRLTETNDQLTDILSRLDL